MSSIFQAGTSIWDIQENYYQEPVIQRQKVPSPGWTSQLFCWVFTSSPPTHYLVPNSCFSSIGMLHSHIPLSPGATARGPARRLGVPSLCFISFFHSPTHSCSPPPENSLTEVRDLSTQVKEALAAGTSSMPAAGSAAPKCSENLWLF